MRIWRAFPWPAQTAFPRIPASQQSFHVLPLGLTKVFQSRFLATTVIIRCERTAQKVIRSQALNFSNKSKRYSVPKAITIAISLCLMFTGIVHCRRPAILTASICTLAAKLLQQSTKSFECRNPGAHCEQQPAQCIFLLLSSNGFCNAQSSIYLKIVQ